MTRPIITGTWIDIMHVAARDGVYWNRKTIAYTEEDWATLIRHLRRDLEVEILMLQNVAKDSMAFYPSQVMAEQWPTGCPDPVGAIITACSREGIQFFPGIGFMAGIEGAGTFYENMTRAVEWHKDVSREVWEQYGHEPAFAGFYTAAEISIIDGNFLPGQIDFVREIAHYWKELAPNLPTISSPYIRGDLKRDDNLVRSIAACGVDIIAYQDGVGFGTKYHAIDPRQNTRMFETLRWAHDQTSVALWANTELFVFENDIHFQPLLPAPFSRIREQIRCAAPYVDRIVAYTMPGLITSQQVCPDLGVPETDRLYWAYQGYRETVP